MDHEAIFRNEARRNGLIRAGSGTSPHVSRRIEAMCATLVNSNCCWMSAHLTLRCASEIEQAQTERRMLTADRPRCKTWSVILMMDVVPNCQLLSAMLGIKSEMMMRIWLWLVPEKSPLR
jgi:hypothetical protein